MASRSPYSEIPNLSGDAGRIEDIRSQGDPSRIFPAMRNGSVDAVTGRINDKPRCRIWRNAALSLPVGAATIVPVPFDQSEFDTDGMWSIDDPTRIYCRTPGVYAVHGEGQYNAQNFDWLWTRIAADSLRILVSITQFGMSTGFGAHCSPAALWWANAGDYIELWLYDHTTGSCAIFTGADSLYLEACHISSFGSDNQ